MEENQNSIVDKDHETEKGKDFAVVVDDQHHERYYTEDNAAEQRAYQSRKSTSAVDGRYHEETSAEISTLPKGNGRYNKRSEGSDRASGGTGVGAIALIISILSLFMMPFILGILGIIIGFSARKRGSSMGSWAIGISAVSIIIGIFILPFF